ncbi:hypothetical protein L3X38_036002 [Prunus dulcis]|uniref:Uncharacterized protein n=1 Tax=Prunus dulcis TaxID=3755 RepID=A0AAD4V0K8_PRUDU|nr:hypothetical protein L3X38_036002 [Prunus dulcis]
MRCLCTFKGTLVWRINWKKPCPKKSIDLCYWKKAREDKQRNIPDPKVAEKAKLIDDLKKQVSEGTLTVSGSNDVLTLALGTPEHGGRVRGVGAGVSPTQFFNL